MIHYEHIKGYNQNGNNALWTWLKFQSSNASSLDSSKLPTIEIATSETATPLDFGYVITQKGENQSVNKPFTFNNTVNFHLCRPATGNDQEINIKMYNAEGTLISNGFKIIPYTSDSSSALCQQMSWYAGNATLNPVEAGYIQFLSNKVALDENSILKINNGTSPNSNSNAASITTNGGIYAQGAIKSNQLFTNQLSSTNATFTSYCQAEYFNSTSDIRAKKDIRTPEWSALNIVDKLLIYNFTYTNTDTPSIGIIAQEAQEIEIEDFSLVNNKEATGVDGDYMSIKESKLVYILWKAIQEQQQQIIDLQAMVNALSKDNTK